MRYDVGMDLILALDISTSIIGWCVLPPDSNINTYPTLKGHIDLRKVKGGFWDKVHTTRRSITALRDELGALGHAVTLVCVEEPLKKFARGRSSAGTISMLARFNALVSFFALETFGSEPLYIDATFARKKIGIPLLSRKKSGGMSQKEQTASFLCERVFKDEKWTLNRSGKMQTYHADEIDAFVICVAGCMGLGEPA